MIASNGHPVNATSTIDSSPAKGNQVDPLELNQDEFAQFQAFIYQRSGIRVPETKRSLLSNRIRRRLKAGDFDGFRSYLKYLTSQQRTQRNREFSGRCHHERDVLLSYR